MTQDTAEPASDAGGAGVEVFQVRRATRLPGHTGRMLGYATAQGRTAPTYQQAQAASRQLNDPFRNYYRDGNAIEPLYDPEKLLQLAEQNAIHAACISARAEDAVGRGWQLVATGREVDRSLESEVGDRLEELTPDISFSELIAAAAWEETAIGWAAWEFGRGDDRKINAIYPLPAHTLRATTERDVYLQIRETQKRYFKRFGCEKTIDGKTGAEVEKTDDPATEVLVFRSYSPRSPWYGVPKWVSAVPAIAELAAIREYNVSFFSSGGMADRLITSKAKEEKAARRVSEQIERGLRSAKGRGHTSIFTWGTEDVDVEIDFLAPNSGTRDGQYREQRRDVVQEILMAHGVPPYRIGWAIMGSLGGSAAREMLEAYYVGKVKPAQIVLEDRLNRTLFGPDGIDLQGHRWKLLELDVSQLDLDLRMANDGVDRGYLTPNDARQRLGYPRSGEAALNRYYMGEKRQSIGEEKAPGSELLGAGPDDASDQEPGGGAAALLAPKPDAGGPGAAVHPLFAGRTSGTTAQHGPLQLGSGSGTSRPALFETSATETIRLPVRPGGPILGGDQ